MGKAIKFIPKGREFDKFVTEQRNINLNLLRGMSIDEDDAKDIYQDSSIALYNNIKEDKLTELTASLSTYFTQICKFQAYKFLRKLKPESSDESEMNSHIIREANANNYSDENASEILELVYGNTHTVDDVLDQIEPMVKDLPDPCRTLLWGRFWNKLSHDELASILKYKSANSSKTMTNKCLRKFEILLKPIIPANLWKNKKTK